MARKQVLTMTAQEKAGFIEHLKRSPLFEGVDFNDPAIKKVLDNAENRTAEQLSIDLMHAYCPDLKRSTVERYTRAPRKRH